jgi:hypothetical protein
MLQSPKDPVPDGDGLGTVDDVKLGIELEVKLGTVLEVNSGAVLELEPAIGLVATTTGAEEVVG